MTKERAIIECAQYKEQQKQIEQEEDPEELEVDNPVGFFVLQG